MLCESAIANTLQNNANPKYDSSEATLIQKGFGSLPCEALQETLKSQKKLLRTFVLKSSSHFEAPALAHFEQSRRTARITFSTVATQPRAGVPVLIRAGAVTPRDGPAVTHREVDPCSSWQPCVAVTALETGKKPYLVNPGHRSLSRQPRASPRLKGTCCYRLRNTNVSNPAFLLLQLNVIALVQVPPSPPQTHPTCSTAELGNIKKPLW